MMVLVVALSGVVASSNAGRFPARKAGERRRRCACARRARSERDESNWTCPSRGELLNAS
jgi:hypothetical protein